LARYDLHNYPLRTSHIRSRLCVRVTYFPGKCNVSSRRPEHAGGERAERCLWQIQRGERVAAVKISRANSEQEILGTATGLFQAQKKPRPFGRGFVFALPIFPVSAMYRRAVRNMPGGSELSAACGRFSEASEWQRSKFRERTASKKFWVPQQDCSRRKKPRPLARGG